MLSRNDFVQLLDEELGLTLTLDDLDKEMTHLAEWDSIQLLRLHGVIEKKTGRQLPMSALFSLHSLGAVHSFLMQSQRI